MSPIRRAILACALIAGVSPALAQAPPPVPALPDTERRTTYAISASQCLCAVGFQIYGDSTDYTNWIEVFVNGALMPQSGNWTIASPTGPLATIPRPISDAVLTFATAQTGTIQIVGARRPRRTSQFQEGVGVAARSLNQVISDLTAMLRENWDKTNDVSGRAVLARPGETLALLPVLASRLNTGACFDASGNLTTCTSIPGSTFSAGSGIALTGSGPTTISADINAGAGITFSGTHPISIAATPNTMTFTQTGTGAVPVTVSSELQKTVRPEQFGALCNGTGDDGPAIQRAIDSVTHVKVLLSSCTYRVVTPIAWTKGGVAIVGAGPRLSLIDFEPGAPATLLSVGSGAAETYSHQLVDFGIVSSDSTNLKIAIKLTETSESQLMRLFCGGSAFAGGYFTGGGGSTCLQTNGRDLTTFENLDFFAEKPIVLNKGVLFALSTDHYVFRDLYLVATAGNPQPCITATDGIMMTNTTFEGRQAWVQCSYGFFVNDLTSPATWNNLSFSGIRTEQSVGGVTGYTFFISSVNTINGLVINNSQLDPTHRGISLHNVVNATVSNNTGFCTTVGAERVIDFDNTNDQIALLNNRWGSACIAATTGTPMVNMWQLPAAAIDSQTVPGTGLFLNTATAATALASFFRAVGTTPLTVATLSTCNAGNTGARSFVTDSNVTFTAGIGGIVGGGGANKVPVTCDGTNWRIG